MSSILDPNTNRKSTYCFVGDDTYEIVYSSEIVEELIKYPNGSSVRGEVVDFDLLPYYIQTRLFEHLKRELEKGRE